MEAERLEVDTRARPRHTPPRVLLTNDDGIGSKGLYELATALAGDHEVVVVAPQDERSGSGTGIGYFDPVQGVGVTSSWVAGSPAHAIDGPPGLAVMSAMLGAFGDLPDVVVSGINPGINTGHSVLHSGTVGAVLTARTFGCDGVAVSLASGDSWHWKTAAEIALPVIRWVLERPIPQPTTINLNVPGMEIDDVRGVRWADLDVFGYFRVAATDDPGERLQFEVGPPEAGLDPASDTALVSGGYATVTPLATVQPAAFPDSPPPGCERFERRDE